MYDVECVINVFLDLECAFYFPIINQHLTLKRITFKAQ